MEGRARIGYSLHDALATSTLFESQWTNDMPTAKKNVGFAQIMVGGHIN